MSQDPQGIRPLFGGTNQSTAAWHNMPAPMHDLQDAIPNVPRPGAPPAKLSEAQRREAHTLFEQARADGLAAAQTAMAKLQQELHDGIDALRVCRASILQTSEAALVDLALAIAREVLLGEVESRRAFTEQMVTHALQLLTTEDSITLHVPPAQLQQLQAQHPDSSSTTPVRWLADPALELGGAIAQCAMGTVDASLTQRLEEMAERLRAIGR